MNKYERSYVLDLVLKVMEGLCEGAGDVPVLVHVTEGTVRTEAPDAGVGGVGGVDPQDGRHELPIRGEEELNGVLLLLLLLLLLLKRGLLRAGVDLSRQRVDPDSVPGQRAKIREELVQGGNKLLV